jgi:hypothetical protein
MYKGLHATRQNQAGKTTETHVASTEYWIATFVATGTQNNADDKLLKFRRSCWNAAAGPFSLLFEIDVCVYFPEKGKKNIVARFGFIW